MIDEKHCTHMLGNILDATNTPTLLPSPPRVVHGSVGGWVWFMRVFIFPHMCVGVGMAGLLVLRVLVVAFGS